MYYSSIGLLAFMILVIENYDILTNREGAFETRAWQVYRRFLFAVAAYYIVDALWGLFESLKSPSLLFADTTLYFILISVGILYWVQYTVVYLEDKSPFGRFLVLTGRVTAGGIVFLTLVNIFTPTIFTVDAGSVYTPLPIRYWMLVVQILLLALIGLYAFLSMLRQPMEKRYRRRALAFFGFIMAVFLFVQLFLPYYPLYSVAYLLGTCLLHTFVVNDEKEEFRREMEESGRARALADTITSLLDNMPGMTFTKDAETGRYLVCNQAFAEYAHKSSPAGVAGLTDAQIFDTATANHFVEDDKMALSMDSPFIFCEDVRDAAGNQRQFQTVKLKYTDTTGRLCVLGMCQDVTEMVRVQRENATNKEAYEKARSAGIIYTHIAQALARGFTELFYINLDTEEFILYRTKAPSGAFAEVRRDWHFFEECALSVEQHVHPDDREAVLRALDRHAMLDALAPSDSFYITYRLLREDGSSSYIRTQVSRLEDDSRFIVIGVENVDEQVRQRLAAERAAEEQTAYARLNALAGDFLCVYIVEPDTCRYREFSKSAAYESFAQDKEGPDFFAAARLAAQQHACEEDQKRFLMAFTRENVMAAVERGGIFTLSYRLMMNGLPFYVQLKAAMVEEKEGPRLIVGIINIDAQVRQEEAYGQRLAQAQALANVDPLTGIKNRHAFLSAEEQLDRRIQSGTQGPFAITILDVNDLKKVNDTQGHQAGDEYLRAACRFICETFQHSPVFRIGGDEFAVISQGSDYEHIDELLGVVDEHNARAAAEGGIVIARGMERFAGQSGTSAVFERADENMYENKCSLKAKKKQP